MSRQFATAQEINYGDINEMDSIQKFTLSYWMKRDATGKVMILGKASSGTAGFWSYAYSDGSIYVNCRNGSTNSASFALNNTDWTYIAMVFDGTQGTPDDRVLAYVNGLPQALNYSGTQPTSTPAMSVDFHVGLLHGLITEGKYANIRFYDSVLNAGQVMADYLGNTPIVSVLNSPLGYGSPEPDYSGNGYNGTVTSATIADSPPIPAQFGVDEGDYEYLEEDSSIITPYYYQLMG